jgi:hypothetical protein
MSQENAEVVRQAFEGWNRGEFDAIVRRFAHENVELHIVAPGALKFGQVWTFWEGKVIRVDSYYTPGEALEAVGLRE